MLSAGSHLAPPAHASVLTYKTILVHVEASIDSAERLQSVVDLAYGLSAKVIGVGGCAPVYMNDIVAIDWQIVRDQEQADVKAAKDQFQRIAGILGDSAVWCSGARYPDDVMAQSAAGADLIVVSAKRGPHDSTVNAGALALMAGIPVLALPAGCTAIDRKRIVVGWKNTREARRAVSDALPLLCEAESVLVVGIQADDGEPIDGLTDVVERLKRHGAKASSHVIRGKPQDAAQDLIACAGDGFADMIVSGAYGHTRMREWYFGGVTSGLLERSDIPVLCSH